ncbi:hypothetical protein K7432_011442 [Basidiobolus ranarum]|uniref:Uncharacterized protein n=1 Tax=Basidiobolus ranarum TaxID=34480 RepID=A0ABR2WMA2_9FUNG
MVELFRFLFLAHEINFVHWSMAGAKAKYLLPIMIRIHRRNHEKNLHPKDICVAERPDVEVRANGSVHFQTNFQRFPSKTHMLFRPNFEYDRGYLVMFQ